MTATTSTIPAFKRALKARLAADPALAGIQVFRADPFPDEPAEERIAIGRARPDDPFRTSSFGAGQTSATTRRDREERYVVEVVVQVVVAKQNSAEAIEERAYEISALIEASIHAWGSEVPHFDGIVRMAQVSTTEDWQGLGEHTREARVTLGIAAAQRIGL